jgi:hypothetical protein
VSLLLVTAFNVILDTQHFQPVWKHARVSSILIRGKDPALPSSYRTISPLYTIGKVFEKIISRCGLLRDERFVFRPKHSTSLRLTRLVERVSRNLGEKQLTGAVFLHVAKAFDTVWVDGLVSL